MVDLVSIDTVVLAGVTAVLVYVTYTLKRATDHLARTQILPRLTLQSDPYYDPATSQHLRIPVVNKGIATAFNTRVFATTRNNVRFEVELEWGRRDISPFSESPPNPSIFIIQGIVEGAELTIELLYEDGEGYHYKREILTRTPSKAKGIEPA